MGELVVPKFDNTRSVPASLIVNGCIVPARRVYIFVSKDVRNQIRYHRFPRLSMVPKVERNLCGEMRFERRNDCRIFFYQILYSPLRYSPFFAATGTARFSCPGQGYDARTVPRM